MSVSDKYDESHENKTVNAKHLVQLQQEHVVVDVASVKSNIHRAVIWPLSAVVSAGDCVTFWCDCLYVQAVQEIEWKFEYKTHGLLRLVSYCLSSQKWPIILCRVLSTPKYRRGGHGGLWRGVEFCLRINIGSYLTLHIIVTLKCGLEVTQGHSNWYHSVAWVWFPLRIP